MSLEYDRMLARDPALLCLPDPVDPDHPINLGLLAEYAVVPQLVGTSKWYNFAGRNHGALTNGPQWAGARGRPGGLGSLAFSAAASQQVSFNTRVSPGATFGLFAWVRPTTLADYNTVYASNNNGLWLRGTGALDWFQGTDHNGTGGLVAAGSWSHVGVTCDGTTLTFYVNGLADPTTFALAATFPTQAETGIGGHGAEYSNGVFDGVTVYAGCPSAASVWSLYSESRLGSPSRWRWRSPRAWFLPQVPATTTRFNAAWAAYPQPAGGGVL